MSLPPPQTAVVGIRPAGSVPVLARVVFLVFLALAVLVAGCGADEDSAPPATGASTDRANGDTPGETTVAPEPTSTSTSTSTPSSDHQDSTDTSGDPEAAARGEGGFACRLVEHREAGEVERVDLVETSGLAASQRHVGVIWATNDSGQRSGIYAVGPMGADLGFFALTDGGGEISTVDVEDLAIVDGVLYLADVGDNGARRDTVAVHALTEPEPGVDGTAAIVETIEFRYPDGPTDAEALLVDPVAGELIVLSKDLDEPSAPTRLYTVPVAAAGGPVVTATAAGSVDVTALTAASDGFSFNTLLFPGSVTGADLSPTGDLIAIRTYGSVWLFPRGPDQTVAEAITGNEPCEAGAAAEAQGESVAFLATPADAEPGSVEFVTISEGGTPPVNVTSVVVSG